MNYKCRLCCKVQAHDAVSSLIKVIMCHVFMLLSRYSLVWVYDRRTSGRSNCKTVTLWVWDVLPVPSQFHRLTVLHQEWSFFETLSLFAGYSCLKYLFYSLSYSPRSYRKFACTMASAQLTDLPYAHRMLNEVRKENPSKPELLSL